MALSSETPPDRLADPGARPQQQRMMPREQVGRWPWDARPCGIVHRGQKDSGGTPLPTGRPPRRLPGSGTEDPQPEPRPSHSLPAPTNPRNVRIRRGEPLAKTPKTQLKRGDRRTVAQDRKFRSVQGRRGGLNCCPGNVPFWLYISCKASWKSRENELPLAQPHVYTREWWKDPARGCWGGSGRALLGQTGSQPPASGPPATSSLCPLPEACRALGHGGPDTRDQGGRALE